MRRKQHTNAAALKAEATGSASAAEATRRSGLPATVLHVILVSVTCVTAHCKTRRYEQNEGSARGRRLRRKRKKRKLPVGAQAFSTDWNRVRSYLIFGGLRVRAVVNAHQASAAEQTHGTGISRNNSEHAKRGGEVGDSNRREKSRVANEQRQKRNQRRRAGRKAARTREAGIKQQTQKHALCSKVGALEDDALALVGLARLRGRDRVGEARQRERAARQSGRCAKQRGEQ